MVLLAPPECYEVSQGLISVWEVLGKGQSGREREGEEVTRCT